MNIWLRNSFDNCPPLHGRPDAPGAAASGRHEGLADARGVPTEELTRLYGIWSDGGCGMLLSGNVQIDQVLRLAPGAAPASAVAGDVYFDAAAAMLRCYDGTTWQDLF